MVRTRLTQSSDDAIAEPQALDANGQPKAVTRALKKLMIDANASLKGKQKENATPENARRQTYHWRGAVYEMTSETPQEWLDQEPERYQKRKRQQEEQHMDDTNGSIMQDDEVEGNDTPPPPPKRKRGRPRKHPLPEEVAPQQSLKRKREATPVRRVVQKKREQDSVSSSARKTRSQGLAEERAKTDKERAKDKGFKLKSIPWADMMTGKIAIDLVKFCALQRELRKLQAEYDRANKLHAQLEQAERARQTDVEAGPLTPAPDQDDNNLDKVECAELVDSGSLTTPMPSRHNQPDAWQTPPGGDEPARELHWSLRTSQDMQNRAEYHICATKLSEQDKHDDRADRIRRDLAIVERWEKVPDGPPGIQETDSNKQHRVSRPAGS